MSFYINGNSEKVSLIKILNYCLKNNIDFCWARIFYVYGKNENPKRIFPYIINNLKENGVIEICPPLHIESRLSIGNISTIVPCIHPYINIIEKGVIYFGTKEFAEQTISSFGFEQGLKASYALAQTALDLIENDSLLNEAKSSLY